MKDTATCSRTGPVGPTLWGGEGGEGQEENQSQGDAEKRERRHRPTEGRACVWCWGLKTVTFELTYSLHRSGWALGGPGDSVIACLWAIQ